jgi:hypothetical protein
MLMRRIKNRKEFLYEKAKIRDLVLPRQAKAIKDNWGEKFLDYEDVDPTDNIIQGSWKLDEEDKNKVLSAFFNCDMEEVMSIFSKLPDKLAEVLLESIDLNLIEKESSKIVIEGLNIKKPTIDQIVAIYDNVFRKISVGETLADEVVKRDEMGRAVMDDENQVIRIPKKKGELVFSKNLVNINSFIASYNVCFPDHAIDSETFRNRSILNLKDATSIDAYPAFKIDFKIYDKDIYLKINHNPKDILNMSISKFYASCMHLYEGGYREQLLSNVFDINSIPAFLIFETPIYWENEIVSEVLPLARLIIRNIENFSDEEESRIFFDRAYPERTQEIFEEIIEKYSKNKNTAGDYRGKYYYVPDINPEDDLHTPYMDRLSVRTIKFIGKNTKSLYVDRITNWQNIRISPKNQLEELVIESPTLPNNLTDLKLNLKWVKFRFLDIKDLKVFENMKAKSIAFDKCKINNDVLKDMFDKNQSKDLKIISCFFEDKLNLSDIDVEELHLIYTFDNLDEINITGNKNLKKLFISGDLVRTKKDREIVAEIKNSGIEVKVVGPVVKNRKNK